MSSFVLSMLRHLVVFTITWWYFTTILSNNVSKNASFFQNDSHAFWLSTELEVRVMWWQIIWEDHVLNLTPYCRIRHIIGNDCWMHSALLSSRVYIHFLCIQCIWCKYTMSR